MSKSQSEIRPLGACSIEGECQIVENRPAIRRAATSLVSSPLMLNVPYVLSIFERG